VGLGNSTEVPVVRVHWPDGRTTGVEPVALDRYIVVQAPPR